MFRFVRLLLGLAALSSAGCMGTVTTRIDRDDGCPAMNPEPSGFGGWPYEAVWVDFGWGNGRIPYRADPSFSQSLADAVMEPYYRMSVPVDAVLDTVLLPVDVVAWCCGCRKVQFASGRLNQDAP